MSAASAVAATASCVAAPRYSALGRRLAYFTPVLATAGAGVWLMTDILRANGLTPAEIPVLVLFALAFSLIAASFWNAVAGFLIQVFARDPLAFSAPVVRRKAGRIEVRTAIIMPAYNEDPVRVCARLDSIYRSLQETGELNNFVFFLLSDTTNAAIGARELAEWRQLCGRLGAHGRIRYRRRAWNTRRKVGNIDDFLKRWGKRFEFMLVLDADSVMAGEVIVDLVKIMQANPRVALLQSLPAAVNQDTAFSRILQFGSRLCSEMLTIGGSFWQLGRANYFGHNALIRIEPFVHDCDLPTVPGTGPLSGDILSHDFIEAALLQRAGWEVWNLAYPAGSYEEMPSNIVDYAKRDRRWCQGNLQHMMLLRGHGLRWMSLLHLFLGIMSYLGSLVWFVMIALGIYLLWDDALTVHEYFDPTRLFPIWEILKSDEAITLFSATIAMLLIPKLLAALAVLRRRSLRAGFGGFAGVVASLLVEIVFMALTAPVMMVFHLWFVFSVFTGNKIGWNAQARGNRGLTLLEAFACQKWQTLVGIAIFVGVAAIAPQHLWWLAPILAGLALAGPLAVVGSRADFGLWLRRRGLFLIPEEVAPPAELRRLTALDGAASA
ncbi:MAG: glucans biosynthesis glucosyltransferase MdoH [Gammaproteobacteria bacterium]|nr:glucans biosynthesis glucosyltransferase MdoH [Gammaproteobacteria bacterium]